MLGRHNRPDGLPPEEPSRAAPAWMPEPESEPRPAPMIVQIKHNGVRVAAVALARWNTIELTTNTGQHVVVEMDVSGRFWLRLTADPVR